MWWFFGNKKEIERVEEDTKKGFENVKKDIQSVSGWIKHLDSERELQKRDVDELKSNLSTIKDEIDGLKNVLSVMNEIRPNRLFKTPKRSSDKQPAVYAVTTGAQTAVQTPKLDEFSVTERAILWVLLNTDMKLSYEDLSAMLGKEKSTLRGQINRIKQKESSLIEEQIEANGKKRVYVPEEIKERMLKKSKVKVKKHKK